MTTKMLQADTEKAIFSEQIKAYFKESNAQNLAGAVVFSLIIWISAKFVPIWTWGPSLVIVYAATIVRSYLIWQHARCPQSKTSKQWGFSQTLWAAVAGTGWGFANTAMSAYVALQYQLFIATVASVSAAASASEGFAYPSPSRVFIVTSLAPLMIWFYTGHDRLHLILGVMLTIFLPMIIWQTTKHHYAFIETLKLRFENEFLANELAQQRKVAEDAGQAKSRFLAAASHDLRQPIQALVVFHELLRPEMTLTTKGEHYFTRSHQAIKAVNSLLDSLLDISKLDSNTVKCELQPVLIGNLFNEMRREFISLAERKGIRLRIVKSTACLETDPGLLAQILRNLISNALRYTHSGTILVGCRHRQNRLDIEVWDTGIGIKDEHQQAIFGEFFQVVNKERDCQQGLGLGLAIVDRAAKLLGATVTVRSRLRQGSCFAVSLPFDTEVAHIHPDSIHESELFHFNLNGRLMVVIENDELIRKGIHSLLENWGCDVISSESGENALAQINNQNKKIDALISDFGLSDNENGIAAIRNVSAHLGYDFPALLITGDTSIAVLNEANKASLKILHKPVRPWLLQQTLNGLLKPI